MKYVFTFCLGILVAILIFAATPKSNPNLAPLPSIPVDVRAETYKLGSDLNPGLNYWKNKGYIVKDMERTSDYWITIIYEKY